MNKLPVYNCKGEEVKKVELPQNIFDVKVNEVMISEMIKLQLMNKMRGLASTKTRSEVRGGGKKPYRQKGTGRARAGSSSSPIWVGGGIAFGPRPRERHYDLPKKARRVAFKSVFSLKAKEGNLCLLDELKVSEPKTKSMVEVIKNLKIENTKVVFLDVKLDGDVKRAAKNIKNLITLDFTQINVHDMMRYEKIVMTEAMLAKLEEVYN